MAEPDGGGSVFEGRASFSSFKSMNVRTQGNTRRENDKTCHGPLSQQIESARTTLATRVVKPVDAGGDGSRSAQEV